MLLDLSFDIYLRFFFSFLKMWVKYILKWTSILIEYTFPLWQSYTCIGQGLQEKFCKAEQDCFGAPGTGWDFSENWRFELKIHKKSKNQNKTSMAKAMVSFRDSQAPSWLSGPRTDGPTELPLIGLDYNSCHISFFLHLHVLSSYFNTHHSWLQEICIYFTSIKLVNLLSE